MTGNSPALSGLASSFLLTWWLHSTILISLAWLVVRLLKPSSHFVREQIWKTASLAGFATAGLQLALGTGFVFTGAAVSESGSNQHDTSRQSTEPTPVESQAGVDSALADARFTMLEILDELDKASHVVNSTSASPDTPSQTTAVDVSSPEAMWQVFPDEEAGPATTLTQDTKQSSTAVDAHSPDPDDTGRRITASSESSDQFVNNVVAVLAAAWMGASVLWLLLQAWQFRRQSNGSRAAAASHLNLLQQIAQRAGIRRQIRLLRSNRFNEPVAFGLFSWTILLPNDIEEKLNRDELQALLSHELAHLVRGDVLWLWIGRLLTTGFAMQPLHFLARRRWQLCAEFQCDDWALQQQISEITLARSLTTVAEWRVLPTPGNALAAGGPRFHVTDRVERLLAGVAADPWRKLSRRVFVQFSLIVLLLAVVLLGPSAATQPPPELSESDRVAEPATQRVEPAAEFNEVDLVALREQLQHLRGDVDEMVGELVTLQPHLETLASQKDTRLIVQRLRQRLSLLQDSPRSPAANAEFTE